MVDRLNDGANKRALELAVSLDKNDLKKNVFTERLPYFIGLMEKYGLDSRNPEHCSIVGRSIEARLETEKQQLARLPETKQIACLDETVDQIGKFKEYFINECMHINNLVLKSYRKWVYNAETNEEGFYANRELTDDNLYLFFIRKSPSLTINCQELIIESEDQLFYGIKIQKSSLFLIKPNSYRYFSSEEYIKNIFDVYFKFNSNNIKKLKEFKHHFNLFRRLPYELENSLSYHSGALLKEEARQNRREHKKEIKKQRTNEKAQKELLKIATKMIR